MFASNFLFLTSCVLLILSLAVSSGQQQEVDASSVTFGNGSVLELVPSLFVGQFPRLNQQGLSPYQHHWAVSLVTPTTFAHCGTAEYMAQGADCDVMKFPNAPISIVPNMFGTGITFTLQARDGLGRDWVAIVNVTCDPSKDTISSPTNSYFAATDNGAIVVTFVFSSKGACLSAEGGGQAPSDEGGITWGGVFLIIFFVPLGLYVIGMVAWNYKQGNTGWDLAPHPVFWKSLPIYAKDGVLFLVAKARGTDFTPSEYPDGSSSGGAGATESAAGPSSGGYAAV